MLGKHCTSQAQHSQPKISSFEVYFQPTISVGKAALMKGFVVTAFLTYVCVFFNSEGLAAILIL